MTWYSNPLSVYLNISAAWKLISLKGLNNRFRRSSSNSLNHYTPSKYFYIYLNVPNNAYPEIESHVHPC